MTREEIINGLQFTIDMCSFDPITGETLTEPRNDLDKITIDACKGAIEALKAEPCEDCVSREDVLKCLSISTFKKMAKLSPEGYIAEYRRRIKSLPSVTPAMERGSWVPVDDEPHEDYECDRCGRIVYCEGDVDFEFKYCPECGAEMWGGESE